MKFRTKYFDQAALAEVREATRTYNTEPSMTRQEFANESNINYLVKAFGIDKVPPPPQVFDPAYYGDVTDIPDLATALNRIRDAQERFQALPASIRERFANRPELLWQFVADPANRAEASEMGLLAPIAAGTGETPPPAPIVVPTGSQGPPTPPPAAPPVA